MGDFIRLLILGVYILGTVSINRYLRSMVPLRRLSSYPQPEGQDLRILMSFIRVFLWPVLWLLWLGWGDARDFMVQGSLLLFFVGLTVLSWLPWLVWIRFLDLFDAITGIGGGLLLVVPLVMYTLNAPMSLLALLPPALFAILPPLMVQLVLFTLGPDLLPLRPEYIKEHRRDIMAWYTALVLGHFRPTWAVENGKIVTRLEGDRFNGLGPSWVIPEPHNVVVLTSGSAITAVDGPEPFLTEGDMPFEVLDLREQIRGERVRARTSNGIELDVPISTIFRIQGSEHVRLGDPWPYRKGSAYTALFSAEVDDSTASPIEGRKPRPWDRLPLDLAKAHVRRRLAEYHLDDIFPVRPELDLERGTLPRAAISGEVRQEVANSLDRATIELSADMVEQLGDEMIARGVTIVGGSIGNRIVPVDPKIVKQRVEVWKAKWMARAMQRQAQAEAKRYELLERSRQAVLEEMLRTLAREHERSHGQDPQKTAALLAVRLLDTLDQIAHEAGIQAMTPESSRDAVRLIRQRVMAQTEILERSTGGGQA